jgi:hypothetical protein
MDVDLINIIAKEHKRHIQEISRVREDHEIKSYFEAKFVDYTVVVLKKYFDNIAKIYCKQNPFFREDSPMFISPEFIAKKNKIAYSIILDHTGKEIRKLLDIERGKVMLYKENGKESNIGLLSEWIYWANKDDTMEVLDLLGAKKSQKPVYKTIGQIAIINPTGQAIVKGWDTYANNTTGKKAF